MSGAGLRVINIKNFKAFKAFHLNLESRNLLIYGGNGSGKSSLYWALYTFLESAGKPTVEVQKYFDPGNNQALVNIHVPPPENESAYIKLTLKEGSLEETFEISRSVHQTANKPIIAKAALASDFITYRFFFKFGDFRNSQDFDIWDLFKREMLPFCHTTSGIDLHGEWKFIESNLPHELGLHGGAITKANKEFIDRLKRFNAELEGVTGAIEDKAREFYAEHFSDPSVPIEIALKITTPASYDPITKTISIPKLQLGVRAAGAVISRPQVFLNEAKLTQIAISIRLAASLVNLHESSIKLLVLDDLLVSFDLNNRMKVVDILLTNAFDNYQKIILTHDLGFYREFRRKIGLDHTKWVFSRLSGDPVTGISQQEVKREIDKAEDYIRNHDLEEAASCLRKAAEDTAIQYRELQEGKRITGEKFVSLTQHLNKAKNVIKARIPDDLFEKVLSDLSPELLPKLIAYDDSDIDSDSDLSDATKSLLKVKREEMRRFLSSNGWRDYQDLAILDRILEMTERVLNPASHWGDPALYQAEVKKAHSLIDRLENRLRPTS